MPTLTQPHLINALVAYKGKPAKIIGQNTHKFELEFADKSTRSVREKDFRFIHPEFTQVSDKNVQADFDILADFQSQTLSIKEITEWLFDEYTPKNAWNTCILVEDGLYFYWQKDQIFIRPQAQVDSIQAKRDAELLQVQQLENCVKNINNNRFDEKDLTYIQSIEKVALNQSKHAKILDALNIENTPENAYALLLKLGYFEPTFNPYPARFNIAQDEEIAVEIPKLERADLTHLTCYAIDNEGSEDADDAISIEGDKIWVHIADVSCLVGANSELDDYAKHRGSNLYLPDQTIHMLPTALTQALALGADKTSIALSVSFRFDGAQINDIEIVRSCIKVTNISYDTANQQLSSNPDLAQLQTLGRAHQKYRDENGSISLNLPSVDVKFSDKQLSIRPQESSPSRDLVAEIMIMTGRAVAQFAIKNEIVMPYAIQDAGDFPQETLDNKDNLTLSQSFKATKYFKRSASSIKPLLHYGLGLEAYLRVTSPLRRYFDLLAHQQLSNFIDGKPTLDKATVREIIGVVNANMPSIGKTIRTSNDHYKCLFLQQNKAWQGIGVVVDTRGDKALFLIPEIGMMTQIKFKTLPQLDAEILLSVTRIDLVERLVNFQPA